MTDLKIFKLDQKFNGTEDLYRYLLKHVGFVGEVIGIQIQEPVNAKPFCIIGKEKITQKDILFFASKRKFPANLNELIIIEAAFNVKVIVFFVRKARKKCLEDLNWIQNLCQEKQIIVVEVSF